MKRNALAASLAQALFCAALLPASLAASAQNQAPDAGTAGDPKQLDTVVVQAEIAYRDRTDDELRADFTTRAAANGQQNYDFTTAIQAFCKRKYESDFSREMTRSAEVYLEDFRK